MSLILDALEKADADRKDQTGEDASEFRKLPSQDHGIDKTTDQPAANANASPATFSDDDELDQAPGFAGFNEDLKSSSKIAWIVFGPLLTLLSLLAGIYFIYISPASEQKGVSQEGLQTDQEVISLSHEDTAATTGKASGASVSSTSSSVATKNVQQADESISSLYNDKSTQAGESVAQDESPARRAVPDEEVRALYSETAQATTPTVANRVAKSKRIENTANRDVDAIRTPAIQEDKLAGIVIEKLPDSPPSRTEDDAEREAATIESAQSKQFEDQAIENSSKPAKSSALPLLGDFPKAVTIRELRESVQETIPTMRYTAHAADAEPPYVVINKRQVRRGQQIVSGVVLQEITVDGLIASTQGGTIKMKALSSWINY